MTAELASHAVEGGRLAIDTEFMSEGRYRALLCLAQVAVPDPAGEGGVRTEILDPLAPLDPAPIAAALADPAVEVVVHAGRQDVALLRRTWETEVTNLFDTQIAAGFLGLGPQEGYGNLVRKVLGVTVKGGEGFTRWDTRPLTDAQLEYARADAALLLGLGSALEERLAAEGRLEWVREECRALESVNDARDPGVLYAKLPRVERLSGRQRGIARELVEWREATAEEIDRPPGSVLPDHVLIEVARRAPANRNDLEQLRGLPAQTLHRRRDDLLAAVRRGADREPPPVTERKPSSDSRDAPLVALAQALVRHRSMETTVASELLATQSDIAQVVSAARRNQPEPAVRVLSGWRRELVGEELLELLAGRRRLGVGADGRLSVDGDATAPGGG